MVKSCKKLLLDPSFLDFDIKGPMNKLLRLAKLMMLSLATTMIIGNGVSAQVIEPVNFEQDTGQERSFVCSAYYSPLPGQSRYATGTYAGDIRLNGSGVRGASGKPVFPGMVAAPPNFAFGTKMFIPGIGMTEVADRGGAIKGSRLDIWFGHGEEALLKALQYGKRQCLVTIYGLNDSLNVDVALTSDRPVKLANIAEDPFSFKDTLDLGSNGESVYRLQQFLADMGYYKGQVTGDYDSRTEEAIKMFQVDNGLIKNADIERPGRFGRVTIVKFQAVLASGRERFNIKIPERNLGRGASGDEVAKLQRALKLLGYDISETAIYDSATVDAVYNFQIKEGIIANSVQAGAGYFGPKTQARMDKLISQLDSGDLQELKEELQAELVDDSGNIEISALDDSSDKVKGLVGLSEGDNGDAVIELQKSLFTLNYLRIEPTGYYGPLTAHAVYKFQQKVGLVKEKSEARSGKIDLETAKLIEYYQAGNANLGIEVVENRFLALVNGRDLKKGMRGQDVKDLQEFLKYKGYFYGAYTTEYFGDVTEKALLQFQVDSGLVDLTNSLEGGVLTNETKALIKELLA